MTTPSALSRSLSWWGRSPIAGDAAGREVFSLPDGSARAVDVRRRHPVEIACLVGRLLLTFEGDPEDHILYAGEAFRIDRSGRAVVAALRPSCVSIRPA